MSKAVLRYSAQEADLSRVVIYSASEINISCGESMRISFLERPSSDIVENTVINGKDGVKALNLIHQACLTVPVAAGNGGKCVI